MNKIHKHRHHIIPRHAGGTDEISNLKLVSVPEHAEEHRLLFEKYGRWQDKLAWLALSGHIGKEEIIKEKQSAPNLGRRLSEKSKKQISEKLTGGTLSEEHKKKIQSGVMKKYSDKNFREKQRNAVSRPGCTNPFYGQRHSEEFKKKQSENMKGILQPKITCLHCGLQGGANAMKRWHFNNCKRRAI